MYTKAEVAGYLLNKLGTLAPLTHAGIVAYSKNPLALGYHNIKHAMDVVQRVQHISEDPHKALLLAALYHDAVYIPGAGSDANERCSAALLMADFKKLPEEVRTPANMDVISEATQLIMLTTVQHHLSPGPMTGPAGVDVLLDADLGSLALPYEVFVEVQCHIIEENFGDRVKDRGVSADFLRRFLTCRPFIYHTTTGRQLWEDAAKQNISRFIQEST